jgi:hypothetical protein
MVDALLEQAVTEAVALATRAPSVHNTQPWRFRIDGGRVECFADFTRQLPVLDPTRRQLYLSCGAALHHLTVALRAAGYDTDIQLTDDEPAAAGEQAPVATVQVSVGKPASAGDVALAAAINERHTQREPFADRKVDHAALAGLRHTAETQGAWLAILNSREDQITLAVLLNHADQAELANPDYQRELHNWRRTEPATDGIPTSALPEPAIRHSEVPVRDFTAGDPHPDQPAGTPAGPPPDERPALLILGTDADSPTQWIHAGQALSALLLAATTQGLRASMLGQVIDLPETRAQLRTLLRLIGEPQMVLRIGYGPAAPATPRRPLTEILS